MNFIYGMKMVNPDGTEWWEVHCYYERRRKRRIVNVSSELACQKVIKLSQWLLGELKQKPLNHHTLERKAEWLIFGTPYTKQVYRTFKKTKNKTL